MSTSGPSGPLVKCRIVIIFLHMNSNLCYEYNSSETHNICFGREIKKKLSIMHSYLEA